MARIFQNGFELNLVGEWANNTGGTISSSVFRSGLYAGRISSLSSGARMGWISGFTGASSGPFWIRVYLRIATLPSAENRIIGLSAGTTLATADAAYITLDNTGALKLYSDAGVVGSASSALSTNTWYRIEMHFDRSPAGGAQLLDARIDGLQFAAATNLTITNTVQGIAVGGNLNAEAQTTGDWYFDDIAVNDNTGSYQNSFPLAGRIIHQYPAGAGDNTQFTIGGSVPAATNWQSVNEVPPNDATTFVSDNTTGHLDDYTVTVPTIAATDIINTVGVGFRSNGAGASNNATIKVRLKAAAAGTTDESSTIQQGSTTYRTNGVNNNQAFRLMDYNKPGTSTSWTKTDLTNAQIGLHLTASNTNAAQITSLYLSVDYCPFSEAEVIFDNTSNSGYKAALSTYNWAGHTITTQSNCVLLVEVAIFATGTVSSITCGASSLNFLRAKVNGVYRIETWYLTTPPTGSSTITVNLSASLTSIATALSYYNTNLSGFPDNQGDNTGTGNPATITLTPVASNTRLVGSLVTPTASGVTDATGQNQRDIQSGALGTQVVSDTNNLVTAAATVITWNGIGGADTWASTGITLTIPALTAAILIGYKALLGVGL